MNVEIVHLTQEHWAAVQEIYRAGIESVLVVTGKGHAGQMIDLLGDGRLTARGSDHPLLSLDVTYKVQTNDTIADVTRHLATLIASSTVLRGWLPLVSGSQLTLKTGWPPPRPGRPPTASVRSRSVEEGGDREVAAFSFARAVNVGALFRLARAQVALPWRHCRRIATVF